MKEEAQHIERSSDLGFAANAIIAGAAKCGTTALLDLLAQHPEVCASRIKEPRFYCSDEGFLESSGRAATGPISSGQFSKGISWYESLFECPDHRQKCCIEATTPYISSESCPDLLDAHAPDCKLIFMIREPAVRVYSHYLEEAKLGVHDGFDDFEKLVADGRPRMRYFMQCSDYERNIMRFRANSKRPILIVTAEALRDQPEELMKEVLNFLELPSLEEVQFDFDTERNRQRRVKNKAMASLITRAQFSPTLQKLSPGIRKTLHHVRNWMMSMASEELSERDDPKRAKEALRKQMPEALAFHQRIQNEGGIMELP